MISVSEALGRVLAESDRLPIQTVSLENAAGRVLAAEIRATHDSPPFDTSAMDGFAVRCEDVRKLPTGLPLQDEVIAGARGRMSLAEGSTIRINTGAPLPRGADAVIRVEDTRLSGGGVEFSLPVAAGQNVRRAGEDYKSGDCLLHAGRRLDARSVGLLASLGRARVPVARRPRAALLATGNEVLDPGEPMEFGKIYNSSRYALRAFFEGIGIEVHDLGTVGDSPAATREALAEGLRFDMLITTGGVSMGTHDFVRPGLLELGAREIFWKVKQRPGAPMFFARAGQTLCFGLPGNPVSVYVTALLYVRAAALRMQGVEEVALPWRRTRAGATFRKPAGLETYMRADASEGEATVAPSAGQGSHQFSALAASSGIVRIGEGIEEIRAGETVDYLDWGASF